MSVEYKDPEKGFITSEANSEKRAELAPVMSVNDGQVTDMHAEDGQYHKSFTSHQIHIISLGSNIGSGLFIGSGAALAAGGPGNIVIAYSLVCSAVWAVLQTLTEMTIAFPVSGNFIDYADRWVDPALAFGAGFAEWLGWTAIVGAEAQFFAILIQFWAKDSFPHAAALAIFVGICCIIFLLPNRIFAWFEYFTSLVKVFMFLIIIVLGLALVCGAGPNGYVHHGETWTNLPAFKNGFSGFANAAILATWAVGDQIFIGVMGGEAHNPRYSMAHACKLVPYRVTFFYMICILWISLLVPSDSPDLLGGSGITASPFIIAIESVGIKGLPDLLNAGIIVGIMAIAAEAIYLSSRILRTMAHQRLIHKWFAHIDSKGRPVNSLIVTCSAAVLFTFINLSSGGKIALNWLIQITATSYFINWIVVAITSYRFHAAIKAQKDQIFEEVYAWKMDKYPVPPTWLLIICTILTISSFYLGVLPPGNTISQVSAHDFFQYTLGIWVIAGLTLIYKLVYRTPWRNPTTADLKTGRRVFSDADIAELNAYYSMSKWRRFGTYLKVW